MMSRSQYGVLMASLILGLISGRSGAKVAAQDRLESVQAPMLWEIVGETPSYLFGTIHITDDRCTTLHPAAKEAFEKCDWLFVETAPKDQLNQLNAISLPDSKITDVLSDEMIARIDKQLADINVALSHNALPVFKIYAWAIVLPSLEAQLKNPNAEILDLKLVSSAQEAGMKIGGLEDPSTQLTGMDALTKQEQLAFLEDSLRSMEEGDEEGEDPEAELAELYLSGDVDKIESFFTEEMNEGDLDEALIEKIMDAMLHDRNERIAKTIVESMKESPDKSFFFAAGTAHFVGDKSVQRYLKEMGVEVRRVEVGEAAAIGN